MQVFAITLIHTLLPLTIIMFLGVLVLCHHGLVILKPRPIIISASDPGGYLRLVLHRGDTFFTISYIFRILAKSMYREIYISNDVSELGRKHRRCEAVSTLRAE